MSLQNYLGEQDKQCISDFHKIIKQGGSYVDKTMFIKQIINTQAKIIIIHRPPKWGKSTNLSMLYYYFGCNDVQGFVQIGKSVFHDKTLTKRLKIFQYLAQTQANLQQFHHPIIFLNLQEEQIQSVSQLVAFLIAKLQKYSQKSLIDLLKGKNIEKTSVDQLISILQSILISVVNELQNLHNKMGCLLFIDNYCAPAEFMIFNNRPGKQIQDYIKIIKRFCECFIKGIKVPKQRKIILTGKMDIWESQIREINQKKCCLKKSYYSDYFGFDQKQINDYYLSEINLDKQQLMSTLKRWHGGYLLVGQQQKDIKKLLYHPYTTKRYIQACVSQKQIVPGKSLLPYKIYNKLLQYISEKYLNDLNKIVSMVKKIQDLNTQKYKFSNYYSYNRKQYQVFLSIIYKQKLSGYIQKELNQQAILAYLLFYNGILTGKYNSMFQRFYIYIPNWSFLTLLQYFLRQKLKTKQTIKDFSYIDIEQLGDVERKFQTAINDWDCVGSLNEFRFNAMTLARYGLSDQPTHRVFTQERVNDQIEYIDNTQNQNKGKILDDCYYPYKNNNKSSCVVHQYKLIKGINPTTKSLDKLLELIFWQIYSNGYFKWAWKDRGVYNDYKKIQKIILRGFIFYKNEYKQNNNKEQHIWKIHSKQISIKNEFAKTLQAFFNSKTIQKKINQAKGDYKKIGKKLLKFTKQNDVCKFTQFITSIKINQIQQFIKQREMEMQGSYYEAQLQKYPDITVENGRIRIQKKNLSCQQMCLAQNFLKSLYKKSNANTSQIKNKQKLHGLKDQQQSQSQH